MNSKVIQQSTPASHFSTMPSVTDYGDNQPLLMDYFGFGPQFYELKFSSQGSSELSQMTVDAFKEAGFKARTSSVSEARGKDGRGFMGPGLDHGVFVPFRIMFGEEFKEVPIVQATIDGSLDPTRNILVGAAVAQLRSQNYCFFKMSLLTLIPIGSKASWYYRVD